LRLLRLLRPPAAEHHELVRHDLRGVAIIAVAVLPFPRPQLPLDVALRPLPQILRRDLGEPTEHHYVMKLRALLPLTRLTRLPLGAALRPPPQLHRRALCEPTDHPYVMKLRALLPLTRLTVLPRFVRRKPNIRHRTAARHVAGFWVRTQAPDKLHLVQTAHVP